MLKTFFLDLSFLQLRVFLPSFLYTILVLITSMMMLMMMMMMPMMLLMPLIKISIKVLKLKPNVGVIYVGTNSLWLSFVLLSSNTCVLMIPGFYCAVDTYSLYVLVPQHYTYTLMDHVHYKGLYFFFPTPFRAIRLFIAELAGKLDISSAVARQTDSPAKSREGWKALL
ncbi:hypothetical protein L873DRAFT_1375081 [Choiromyces venosus 120613-1]|uniref:Uncharacterized protein n=1 Tax=Choiromyces venosus 120613-1 TaxID=1336337 RepID=A0A3N4JDL9_9PEZI|nr:hypothetical protein L873DRAFT_1375081 [Choiromyces venosus 120613-1]